MNKLQFACCCLCCNSSSQQDLRVAHKAILSNVDLVGTADERQKEWFALSLSLPPSRPLPPSLCESLFLEMQWPHSFTYEDNSLAMSSEAHLQKTAWNLEMSWPECHQCRPLKTEAVMYLRYLPWHAGAGHLHRGNYWDEALTGHMEERDPPCSLS